MAGAQVRCRLARGQARDRARPQEPRHAEEGPRRRHRRGTPSDETIDRAVTTIGKSGPLATARPPADGNPSTPREMTEMISTEALALIPYFARHRAPTHEVAGAASVPPQLVVSVLKE